MDKSEWLSSRAGTDTIRDRPVFGVTVHPHSTLPAHDRFTMVFEGDLRKIMCNPFLVDTPFGRAVAIGIGDALDAIDYSDAPA